MGRKYTRGRSPAKLELISRALLNPKPEASLMFASFPCKRSWDTPRGTPDKREESHIDHERPIAASGADKKKFSLKACPAAAKGLAPNAAISK